ncbi:hypothetical protein [Tessaracoccus coleopterorum]|nr:hypothetical protein [Tessaracoccus coleopterorum]
MEGERHHGGSDLHHRGRAGGPGDRAGHAGTRRRLRPSGARQRRRRDLGHRRARHPDVRVGALHLQPDGLGVQRLSDAGDLSRLPGHRQILAYLRGFADAYGLTDAITFGADVTALDKAGDRWRVRVADGTVTDYRAVVVCTGAQWTPNAPAVDGFTGEVRHSVEYRSRGSSRAAGCWWSGRQLGVRHRLRRRDHRGRGVHQHAARLLVHPQARVRHPLRRRRRQGSFLPKRVERALLQPLLRLLVGDLTKAGLQRPEHKLFETHPVMNDQLLHHLRHGDVTARVGIRSASGNTVTFADGTSADFDLILLATGYLHAVPFAQRWFGDPQHPTTCISTPSRAGIPACSPSGSSRRTPAPTSCSTGRRTSSRDT